MNIVMIGHSGVGKTTYMVTMYESLQNSINGFTLQADSQAVHDELIERGQRVKQNIYPHPSSQRDSYEFTLKHHDEEIFEFNWVDYRGGALLEKTTGNADATQLIEDIQEADGVIIFCDSEQFAKGNVQSREIRRMINLLTDVVEDLEHLLPLVIVMTKADLIDEFDDDLIWPLNKLIETVKASEWVRGTLIPISCGLNCQNVELPVLFALQTGILVAIIYLKAQIEALVNEILEEDKKLKSFTGFFEDIFIGERRKKMVATLENAQEREEILNGILPSAEALNEYLEELVEF